MHHWLSKHIKNELLLWFFVLAFLPLLTVLIVNFIFTSNNYEERAKLHLQYQLNEKVKQIENFAQNIQKRVELMSNLPDLQASALYYLDYYKKHAKSDRSQNSYSKSFHILRTDLYYYDIFIINMQGDVVFSVAKESDLDTNLKRGPFSSSTLAEAFRESAGLVHTVTTGFSYYKPSKRQAGFIATPIIFNKELKAILAVQINEDKVFELIQDHFILGDTGEFVTAFEDSKGEVRTVTPLRFPNTDLTAMLFNTQGTTLPIHKAIAGENGVDVSYDYRGEKVVAAWQYVPTYNWGIVAKVDYQEIFAALHQHEYFMLILLLFVVLGITLVIISVARHIVYPIQLLTKRMQAFTKGEALDDEPIEVHNEIGMLYDSFTTLATSLSASQQTIKEYAQDLEDKVDRRTQELEDTKNRLLKTNMSMQRYLSVIDRYVITSTTDKKGVILSCSEAFVKISGYAKSELIGKTHKLLRHPEMSKEFYQEMWSTILSGRVWEGEIQNLRKDGSTYWVLARITPDFEEGEIIGFSSVREDISDKKQLEKISSTDALTQLYNRRYMTESLSNALHRAERYHTTFALIIIDIDFFKDVNDTYGHDVGDEVLIVFSHILKEHIRNIDVLARWGGEEFLLLCSDIALDGALALAEKLRLAVESHEFEQVKHKTASFGVTAYKSDDSEKSMLKRADEALYEAKEQGRNKVVAHEV